MMDPASIIAGILRTPHGREAAADIAGAIARPAKGFAAMTGMADPSVAPWLQPSIIPEKYNHPYGTPPAEIERAQQARIGEDLMGGVGNIARVGPKIAQALRATPAESAGIRAYHGSPHDFDKFSMSKIGTGEGAQAYGHGLYFAEKEGVARSYRDTLSQFTANKKPLSDNLSIELGAFGGKVDDLLAFRREQLDKWVRSGVTDTKGVIPSLQRDIRELERLKNKAIEPSGKMYEVNIRAKPEEFLDWDKPLSGQAAIIEQLRRSRSPKVREIASDEGLLVPSRSLYGRDLGPYTGEDLYKRLALTTTGGNIGGGPQTGMALNKAGIPGIRYLDQGSRGTTGGELIDVFKKGDDWFAKIRVQNRGGVGFQDPATVFTTSMPLKSEQAARDWAASKINQGTSNYVLFRDDIIDILRKYGIPPVGIAGVGALGAAAMPDQAQAADLSPTGIARALREAK